MALMRSCGRYALHPCKRCMSTCHGEIAGVISPGRSVRLLPPDVHRSDQGPTADGSAALESAAAGTRHKLERCKGRRQAPAMLQKVVCLP